MLRICEGLEHVRLFIDDIVCFSKNGGEHVNDLRKFLERLTNFNLKLPPKKAHLGVKVVKVFGSRRHRARPRKSRSIAENGDAY